LEIGKIESNFSKLNITTQDMVKFSKYCMEALESLALEKDIELKFQTNKAEILMSFDAEKMQLILNNLLSNAIKFTPKNGLIDVTVSEINKHVEIQVKDSGIGIPNDSLEKIFDRYYRVENKAVQSDSIGLGLALTRELVKLMNGTIIAQNNESGGACFVVELPILISEEIQITESDPVEISKIEINTAEDQNMVLIIEDNQDVLDYTTSILKDSYQIVTASNGKLGFDKALEVIPDLIVSDVMMPVMDGFEACEKLKSDFRTDHIPIVMLTARADMGSKISGLQQGADAYLSKPFNREELLAHIDNLIKIREKLKEKYSQSILSYDESKPKVSNKFLDKIKDVVMEHLSDDTFGIQNICSEIGVSRAQFHRKLKALTGLSASIFIREIRLANAFKMIKETTLNISEIAYSVGFTDPNYFSKLFHEKYHKTPSQIRERQ
jgi:CheY-like chemotaxis protein/AraC-like DNA-binding protein/two-component sensor histidine kinase